MRAPPVVRPQQRRRPVDGRALRHRRRGRAAAGRQRQRQAVGPQLGLGPRVADDVVGRREPRELLEVARARLGLEVGEGLRAARGAGLGRRRGGRGDRLEVAPRHVAGGPVVGRGEDPARRRELRPQHDDALVLGQPELRALDGRDGPARACAAERRFSRRRAAGPVARGPVGPGLLFRDLGRVVGRRGRGGRRRRRRGGLFGRAWRRDVEPEQLAHLPELAPVVLGS